MYIHTQTGMPIARALFLNELDDINVFTYADQQFFIGKNLMVAPVTDQNWNKEVYLPKNYNWYVFDIDGGALPQPTNGGQTYSWYVPLDLVPVYIREGAIIPVRQLEQYVGELSKNYLNFYIYPGKNSEYQLYLDDKVSVAAAADEVYRTTTITAKNTERGKEVTFMRTHDNFTPVESYFYISFLGVINSDAGINAEGKQLKMVTKDKMKSSKSNVYYYDEENQKIVVKVFDKTTKITIGIDYLFQYNFETNKIQEVVIL